MNQRIILGEPVERNPAFVVDYLSCASKNQRTGKRSRREDFELQLCHIVAEENHSGGEGGVFSPHPRKKDGFIHMALWMFTGSALARSGHNRGRG